MEKRAPPKDYVVKIASRGFILSLEGTTPEQSHYECSAECISIDGGILFQMDLDYFLSAI